MSRRRQTCCGRWNIWTQVNVHRPGGVSFSLYLLPQSWAGNSNLARSSLGRARTARKCCSSPIPSPCASKYLKINVPLLVCVCVQRVGVIHIFYCIRERSWRNMPDTQYGYLLGGRELQNNQITQKIKQTKWFVSWKDIARCMKSKCTRFHTVFLKHFVQVTRLTVLRRCISSVSLLVISCSR